MSDRPLIFLDTETTGLDVERHSVFEIAYADESSDVSASFVAHSLEGADPVALRLNGYFERLDARLDLQASAAFEADLIERLKGATVVASNPRFDLGMLRRRWGFEPWHYRTVDLAAYAMPILGYERPQGLATIGHDLDALGIPVFPSDHTAASDVYSLRDAFYALRELAEGPTSDTSAIVTIPQIPHKVFGLGARS